MGDMVYGLLLAGALGSGTALFLLAFQWLVREHMTAKWHAGIWLVLFVQLAGISLWIDKASTLSLWNLLPIPQAMEFLRHWVERITHWAYTGTAPTEIIRLQDFLTTSVLLDGRANDFLSMASRGAVFLWAGVAVVLIVIHFGMAVRLHRRIGHCPEAPSSLKQRVQKLSDQYFQGTMPVSIRLAEEGHSPYVCGFIRPILVIPAHMADQLDDRVLLHELSHLYHWDVGKNYLILLFRFAYWWNPLLWWILGRVSDDLETACDERVLALLEPSQQVDYGRLLLSMVEPAFRRRMGTSCIAGGESHIRRRVIRTARFKEITSFSRRTGVVMAFLLLILCSAMPVGAQLNDHAVEWKTPETWESELRVPKASDPMQALWAYGWGTVADNGWYRYAVAEQTKQAELEQEFLQNQQNGLANPWHWSGEVFSRQMQDSDRWHSVLYLQDHLTEAQEQDMRRQVSGDPQWFRTYTPEQLEEAHVLWQSVGFQVYNLVRQGEVYGATVEYPLNMEEEEVQKEGETDVMFRHHYVVDTVRIFQEDGRWVVRRINRQLMDNATGFPTADQVYTSPLRYEGDNGQCGVSFQLALFVGESTTQQVNLLTGDIKEEESQTNPMLQMMGFGQEDLNFVRHSNAEGWLWAKGELLLPMAGQLQRLSEIKNGRHAWSEGVQRESWMSVAPYDGNGSVSAQVEGMLMREDYQGNLYVLMDNQGRQRIILDLYRIFEERKDLPRELYYATKWSVFPLQEMILRPVVDEEVFGNESGQ
ncbi:MAG: M56 family metallopeptidase [Eubacteriales bacterium]|jgi:beta-lactamase regulating signal transducer with metallopeptidase domain